MITVKNINSVKEKDLPTKYRDHYITIHDAIGTGLYKEDKEVKAVIDALINQINEETRIKKGGNSSGSEAEAKAFKDKYAISPEEAVKWLNRDIAIDYEGKNPDEFYGDLLRINHNANLKLKKNKIAGIENLNVEFSGDLKLKKAPALRKKAEDSLELIVSRDQLRPVMSGVYVEEDRLIATDAHKLVVLEAQPDKKDIGKIININPRYSGTDAKYVEGKYPNYEAVIPRYEGDQVSEFFDIDRVLNEVHTLVKYGSPVEGLKKLYLARYLAVNPDFLIAVLRVLRANGVSKIRFGAEKSNRAIVIFTDTKSKGLVMPIYIEQDLGGINYHYHILESLNVGLNGDPGPDNFFFETKTTPAPGIQEPGLNAEVLGVEVDDEIVSDFEEAVILGISKLEKVSEYQAEEWLNKAKTVVDLGLKAKEDPLKVAGAIIKKIKEKISGKKDPEPKKTPQETRPRTTNGKGPKTLADTMNETNNNEIFQVNGPIGRFLGDVEIKPVHSVVTTLDAEQGAGKTRFFFQIMNALAGSGLKCLFYSLEEHPQSKLFKDKVSQYIDPANLQNIIVEGEIEDWSKQKKLIDSVDAIFIDSFQKLPPNIDLDEDLRKAYNGKWFFVIYQQTAGKTMRGGSKAAFDGDIILRIKKHEDYRENYAYANKNRYSDIPDIKYNIYNKAVEGDQEDPGAAPEPSPEPQDARDQTLVATSIF